MKTSKIAMTTGVALMVLMMGGIANATSVSFSGFPSPLPYTYGPKIYSDFLDLGSNSFLALSDDQSTIKWESFVIKDVDTISFTGTFAQSGIYDIKYTIEVAPSTPAWLYRVGIGMDQSYGVGAATLQKKVWDLNGNLLLNQTITGSGPDFAIPLEKGLIVEDILTVNDSSVNSISNSFTESAAVPEPATLSLLGIGLAGFAIVARRRAC